MSQPEKWQLIDTGNDYPARFAMRALVATVVDDEAVETVRLMAGLNGADATAELIRKAPDDAPE